MAMDVYHSVLPNQLQNCVINLILVHCREGYANKARKKGTAMQKNKGKHPPILFIQ
jgi:hypothetical protein